MTEEFMNDRRMKIIAVLSLFNFVFLGTEYLFDNMMTYVVNAKEVVIVQSYILGASVIGYLLFPVFYRLVTVSMKYMMVFAGSVVSIICIFVIQQHASYESILTAGCIVFILLGIAGSGAHYLAMRGLENDKSLAKTVGAAYAVGLLFQFLNNNLVDNDMVESIVLSVFLTILVILLVIIGREMRLEKEVQMEQGIEKKNELCLKHPLVTGGILLISVVLMTCIFSTLDNVVTLFHANGSMDIGQWPRLLLALSGLTAGVLFDMKERQYMNIIMYCVTLLSTICVLVIVSGGPFLIGLIVFYLSAGFFVVFFTTGFMDLSKYMKIPELWAGIGRAVNNICAGIMATVSLALLETENTILLSIMALILFVAISVTMFLYANQFRTNISTEEKTTEEKEEKFVRFSEVFSLTTREQEVLKFLLVSDDSVQDIADQLFISRAALYRHITALNEKTVTKSRIGLLQFYYAWKEKN